ncbi:hypothetical protein K3495_g3976 [Podosphaera aphanis]|nr:hypothetical protein K3495_g3976 [Podosphaera aphanis]
MVNELLRPLLLPQNRKIRHLRGIYLRNLRFNQANDDITSKKRFTEQVSQLHVSESHHDRSIESLPSSKLPSGSVGEASTISDDHEKRLEEMIESRVADTFFTIHCASQNVPIYISEVVEKSINPSFRLFDLSMFGPATTRLDTIIVTVWAKKDEFVPLIEVEVNLQILQFVGQLQSHVYPPNCLLFHLVDGIYSMDLTAEYPKPKPGQTLATSSYSALMRLANLDESIQDALATREELAAQINALLQTRHVDESLQARENLKLTNSYLLSARKFLENSIRRRKDLKASIEARKEAIKAGKEMQAKAMEDMRNAEDKLKQCRIMINSAANELSGQRRRICEELQAIYPIEPTKPPFTFSICDLELSNIFFDDVDEEKVSAALGYVARIVDLLQYYLSVPLPYPISPNGPRVIIHDFISILQDNQRIFPLYLQGTVRFRFDYGVFLLNKNIEWLAKSQGLKILDIRQTLPNLKYLLYVCSAGNSELPVRKAGGIKGLLSGNGVGATCIRQFESRPPSRA